MSTQNHILWVSLHLLPLFCSFSFFFHRKFRGMLTLRRRHNFLRHTLEVPQSTCLPLHYSQTSHPFPVVLCVQRDGKRLEEMPVKSVYEHSKWGLRFTWNSIWKRCFRVFYFFISIINIMLSNCKLWEKNSFLQNLQLDLTSANFTIFSISYLGYILRKWTKNKTKQIAKSLKGIKIQIPLMKPHLNF